MPSVETIQGRTLQERDEVCDGAARKRGSRKKQQRTSPDFRIRKVATFKVPDERSDDSRGAARRRAVVDAVRHAIPAIGPLDGPNHRFHR